MDLFLGSQGRLPAHPPHCLTKVSQKQLCLRLKCRFSDGRGSFQYSVAESNMTPNKKTLVSLDVAQLVQPHHPQGRVHERQAQQLCALSLELGGKDSCTPSLAGGPLS